MVEVPSQISFEHMLAHMFPGFFTAITLFMILDLRSSSNISAYVFGDFNALLGFFGAIILVGTILGIIIDGIHHYLIEQICFERYLMNTTNDIKSKEILAHFSKSHCESDNSNYKCSEIDHDCPFRRDLPYLLIKIFYLFDATELSKYIEVYEYHRKEIYHYYEFFANTFMALIPFTIVAPIYI